jgi:hypothetical protein
LATGAHLLVIAVIVSELCHRKPLLFYECKKPARGGFGEGKMRSVD